jgi:hypothetical protein
MLLNVGGCAYLSHATSPRQPDRRLPPQATFAGDDGTPRIVAQGSSATYVVFADTFWNTLDHRHLVKRIKPGPRRHEDADASGTTITTRRAASGNPMVGPFYVEAPEPGDAIVSTSAFVSPPDGVVVLSPRDVRAVARRRRKALCQFL